MMAHGSVVILEVALAILRKYNGRLFSFKYDVDASIFLDKQMKSLDTADDLFKFVCILYSCIFFVLPFCIDCVLE